MKIWEMKESLRVILSWTRGLKNSESLGKCDWSEEEKADLHQMAWELVELTRPDDEEFKARMSRHLRIIS